MMRYGRIFFIACLLLNLVACGTRVVPIQGQIEDMSRLPQDVFSYIDKADVYKPLLSEEAAKEANERSTRLFFKPWHLTQASISKEAAYVVLGTEAKTSKPRGVQSNLLPWTQKDWQALAENALPASYPSMAKRAITVRPTSVRDMPTMHPRFANPNEAGEGYPFDYAQTSSIPLGMPLFVVHQSLDGAWYYVETALISGWISAYDMAFVDDAFVERYEGAALVAIVDDKVSLFDGLGNFLVQANMGTYLPEAQVAKGHAAFDVLVPMRQPDGSATLVHSYVSVAKGVMKPAFLTPYTIAQLAMRVLDRPYGWGGMYEDRDCSSLLRDIFLAAGVWLPRNSAAQAQAWKAIPFGDIDDKMKREKILREGVPFATLLWMKGHIALYMGSFEGEPIILHSIWGLRTFENGKEGRHILGRVVITTTEPGKELPNRGDSPSLLRHMQGMSIL